MEGALTWRLHVEPLAPDDTAAYVRARLARAGCEREIFTTDALSMLHEATGGSMRAIDRLAHAPLRLAERKRHRLIERDTVAGALDNGGRR